MKTTTLTEQSRDAALGRAPSYWHPYAIPSENRFIKQAQKAQEQKASAPGRNRGQKQSQRGQKSVFKWITNIFRKNRRGNSKDETAPGTSGQTAGSADKGTASPMVQLFNDLFQKDKKPEAHFKLAQEAVEYLLRTPGVRQEELSEWVPKLIDVGSENGHGHNLEFRSTLFYGLHTLVLKHYANDVLRRSILSQLNKALEGIRTDFGPAIVSEWDKELYNPSSGLSKKIGNWKQLKDIITYEPSLKDLRIGLNNKNKASIIQNLDYIKTIFAISTMRNYSAETRVASIGVLSEIIKQENSEHIKGHAALELALSLKDPENTEVFLFDHEKKLLESLTAQSNLRTSKSPKRLDFLEVN
ncbi:hypothetical protein PGT21_026439 [Puccinia graminis f. sp. tritici]|uniref:Uncharacterized protein n=1 Tax=Puccinia graminis f. sp. tritici TaxID=56615 RepID=A0A5B0P8V6_PUCGR|nr:hypothetical protein PGT21_026439 [Puccinia graminis f. sp. tritici]KAA1117030.1 hypothetical protein PGTUg99_034421 [Puccinia graminis f. sp. tritici]